MATWQFMYRYIIINHFWTFVLFPVFSVITDIGRNFLKQNVCTRVELFLVGSKGISLRHFIIGCQMVIQKGCVRFTGLSRCLRMANIPHGSDKTGSRHSKTLCYQGYPKLNLDGLLHISIEYCSFLFKKQFQGVLFQWNEKKKLLGKVPGYQGGCRYRIFFFKPLQL